MRRTPIALLVLLLLLPVAAHAQQAGPTARDVGSTCDGRAAEDFSDVDPDGVFARTIACIASYEITLGFDDGTFRPGVRVTRGQVVAFLRRTLAVVGATYTEPAGDICDGLGGPFAEDVELLLANDVVGIEACDVGRRMDRALMAAWTDTAATYGGALVPPDRTDWYRDDDGLAEEEQIDRLTSRGVVTGLGGGLFDPTGTVTRGQMSAFVARSLDAMLDAG